MKKIFALILSCCVLNATGQITEDSSAQFRKDSIRQMKRQIFNFKTALSFNPSLLAATDIAVMFGIEHRLKTNIALVLDAGYIIHSTYFSNQTVLRGVSGFNIRPGIKFYINDSKRVFLMMQMFYKQVDYRVYDWLGKNCVNTIPTFEQLQNFTYSKKTVSFNLISGYPLRISNRIMIEGYGGLGLKFKNQKPTEENACYRNNERLFIITLREHSVSPNLVEGVKVLVRID